MDFGLNLIARAPGYEARTFGVHSAMPSATAGRLCPKGIFVRPRLEVYQDDSRQIMRLVAQSGAVIPLMRITLTCRGFARLKMRTLRCSSPARTSATTRIAGDGGARGACSGTLRKPPTPAE